MGFGRLPQTRGGWGQESRAFTPGHWGLASPSGLGVLTQAGPSAVWWKPKSWWGGEGWDRGGWSPLPIFLHAPGTRLRVRGTLPCRAAGQVAALPALTLSQLTGEDHVSASGGGTGSAAEAVCRQLGPRVSSSRHRFTGHTAIGHRLVGHWCLGHGFIGYRSLCHRFAGHRSQVPSHSASRISSCLSHPKIFLVVRFKLRHSESPSLPRTAFTPLSLHACG